MTTQALTYSWLVIGKQIDSSSLDWLLLLGSLFLRCLLLSRSLTSLFGFADSELPLLLLILGSLSSRSLFRLESLLLSDLLTAKGLAPLVELGRGDLCEEKLGLANLLAGLDHVTGPCVGNRDQAGAADLLQDSVVDTEADDSGATVRLVGKKLVVQLAVLYTKLDGIELVDEDLESLVDLLLVLFQALICVLGVVGHSTIKLGLGELEDSLVQVTEVLEKVVVIAVNEFLPLELRVGSFGTSREKVVSPDIGIYASFLGSVTKHANTTGLAELSTLVVELRGREDDGVESAWIVLEGVDKATTSIALITTSTEVVADATFSLDETVCKELAMVRMRTERLSSLALLNVVVLPKLLENVLHNLRLLIGWRSAEDVKVDSEPVVDPLVKGVVLGAKVGGRETFLESLGLGSGTVLVGTADVDGVEASGSAVASKHVGREDTANDVTQMGDVVDVGKGTGDKNVALALLRENG
ncbi:hypothetical protein HG530_002270 [Fusarium avenaceum]|nr:hypothetical protein HG530_002270 [Fusarium avenaceum]